MSYIFPKAKSVENGLLWQIVKLAEECGEVAQARVKDKTVFEIADEVIDVMQVCENILHTLNISEDQFEELCDKHERKCRERNYYYRDQLD